MQREGARRAGKGRAKRPEMSNTPISARIFVRWEEEVRGPWALPLGDKSGAAHRTPKSTRHDERAKMKKATKTQRHSQPTPPHPGRSAEIRNNNKDKRVRGRT